jgi:hypothetical protein
VEVVSAFRKEKGKSGDRWSGQRDDGARFKGKPLFGRVPWISCTQHDSTLSTLDSDWLGLEDE